MHELALLAGSAAAAIFMIAQLPMLIKACRTKNLASYSFANIGLANLGNLLYSVYVLHVPIGPVWAIHLFNQTTSGLMLFLYVRYRRAVSSTDDPGTGERDHSVVRSMSSASSSPGRGCEVAGRELVGS
jgi:uncharacterized protein with PQ loop repeat